MADEHWVKIEKSFPVRPAAVAPKIEPAKERVESVVIDLGKGTVKITTTNAPKSIETDERKDASNEQ